MERRIPTAQNQRQLTALSLYDHVHRAMNTAAKAGASTVKYHLPSGYGAMEVKGLVSFLRYRGYYARHWHGTDKLEVSWELERAVKETLNSDD